MQQNEIIQPLSQQVLFVTDVVKIIGRNRLTLRRWWTSGKFPMPSKLHGTTLVWRAQAIDEWLNRNIG